jgi:hypothetical protein
MTTILDIGNRSLQAMGTRTNMSLAEFNGQTSNEAIQVQLAIYAIRDEVLRMAPWNAATNVINLTYITSSPGTPQNPSQLTPLWKKGQPSPPWTYEYQYPVDCLRPLWIIPATQTGFAGGVPITTAVTGGAASIWTGPAAKFKVGIDQFYGVVGATVNTVGGGYQVGDLITLFTNPVFGPGFGPGFITTQQPPLGAPAILRVTSINSFGGITGIAVVNTFQQTQPENSEPVSGSYFNIQPGPLGQISTTGLGAGALFDLTWSAQMDQRIILTNQEFATLCYIKQVQDPNVMDPQLIQAWVAALGARLIYQLSGDKAAANQKLMEANSFIMEARKSDGNEGLTVNDVTPDWIRTRGINYPSWEYSPNNSFDWGSYFTPY